jgi:hypothetical protein
MNEQHNGHTETSRQFRPAEHLIQLKGKDYLPVQWRLVWFRQECPQGSIETEIIHLDLEKDTEEEVISWNPEKRRSEKSIKTAKGLAVVRATVRDGRGGVATGTKMEKAASFGDWLEKAETGAIGRALAGLGYGTQFAPELNEEHRIVDSPVERGQANGMSETSAAPAAIENGQTRAAASNEQGSATEPQISSIRKLCQSLGKAEPANMTTISALNAGKLIKQLTAEYKELKQSKAS